jgi:hypothetical protein
MSREKKTMRDKRTSKVLLLAGLAAATVGAPDAARADATIEQQTTFDFAIIKAHGKTTEYITADKQRRDSDLHCEGFMSMLCGNSQSAEIIRLDRDVQWVLEPKKKEYRETAFPTAAQRQAAEQEAQAMMEKLKQCPAMQQTASGPDTSKCEMSPPKIEVKQTGTHAMFAGHDAQLTQATLTQSCTNKETGDVCDFVFALDTWLTQDQIAGVEDQKAFRGAYLKKLGLDDRNSMMQKQMRQFLAPYADTMKQLSGNAGELKGYPLKTAMRIAFGGAHCAAAKSNQQANAGGGSVVGDASQAAGTAAGESAAGAAGSAAGAAAASAAGNSAASSVLGSAASTFGSKLVSGLFTKKKTDAAAASAPTSTGSAANGPAPGLVQAAEITVETTSIGAGAVPATQFDIPPGWKRIEPQPGKAQKEFTCPKSGA